NPADAGVGVRGKPPEAGTCARTGSGLAQDFFFREVSAQAASGAIAYCPGHAIGDFRNQRSNVETAFNTWLEVSNGFSSRRMLQVVQGAAVSNRRNQRAQLQRCH